MLLNQTAEYALRAVAVLAGNWPNERITAKDLAQRANMPVSYASKVMRKLVVARLVDSQRGHHGGFRLTRAPGSIAIIEILNAVDFNVSPDKCAFGIGRCNLDAPCALHDAYRELERSFKVWARTTYLSVDGG